MVGKAYLKLSCTHVLLFIDTVIEKRKLLEGLSVSLLGTPCLNESLRYTVEI